MRFYVVGLKTRKKLGKWRNFRAIAYSLTCMARKTKLADSDCLCAFLRDNLTIKLWNISTYRHNSLSLLPSESFIALPRSIRQTVKCSAGRRRFMAGKFAMTSNI